MKAHFSTGLCACWAWRKKALELTNIFLINLLLGWTVFGWFVAFAWALSGRDYRGSSPTMTEVVTPSQKQPPRKRWKPTKIQRSASSRWP